MTAPPTTEAPQLDGLPTVDGYRIEALAGSGGMARVYRAVETGLERTVAIKVLYGHGPPEQRERFEREARLVATLQHPNIISIYRVTRTGDGEPCIVMPWLPATLADRQLPLAEGEVRSLLVALLDALGYAQAAQVVHRDIKPDNVLFDSAGRVLLADFGVALKVGGDARLTGPGLAVGSARYMSPEQALGREVDARSDLYSLGIVAYEMLTGAPPFLQRDAISAALAHVEAAVPPLPATLAHWQPWIDQALAKLPDARFPDAAAMRAALPVAPDAALLAPAASRPAAAAALQTRLDLATPAPLLQPRRMGGWWLAAAAALLAVLAGAWWLGRSGGAVADAASVQPVAAAPRLEPPPAVAPAEVSVALPPDGPVGAALASPPADLPGPGAAFERFRDGAGPWLVQVPAELADSRATPFAISQSEVTRAEYSRFASASRRRASACDGRSWSDPGFPQADDHPVVCVSHADARAYASWLSQQTGRRYRLPNVKEWQHLSAPIAGQALACDQAQLDLAECPRTLTASVESFIATAPGVFGVIGNVREWTADCSWKTREIKRNPVGRVFRNLGRKISGKDSLPTQERYCAGRQAVGSSFRDSAAWPAPLVLPESEGRPDLGFRVVRES